MRAVFLDSLRGLAVIWMIIFHTAYDLKMFQYVTWNFSEGFWYAFPRVIAFTFLFCVGMSLNYGHRPKINWKSLNKRSLKLGGAALAVSIGSYIAFPSQWIFFGTLHCIFVGSILGALVVNHRKLAWGLLAAILVLQYLLHYDIRWVSSILQKPSMDFIPIYPWFWAILLGILVGPYLSRNTVLQQMKPNKFLNFLGQHSLKIYLIHQPIIFGSIWLVSQLV
ncbi:heparan-alpha-glucosaminide N-acetyltransferase [Peredibacter starrii]|uniref:Heparan-alpha-glucosaminide N-acetyltransferase n=1 Tax=Peredibacter starrii TaxID=28202 RepID=A0AAX4HJL4_9BACT|nr:heparan-alpha-glucosaminide N-acetyltransferase [Peredibacter starrii]WPU63391.1 heparan-alpha-glucosaminide N-acetyltransferase [Peredibacter starrii]